MMLKVMDIGYRGTRINGDKSAPLLEEELEKFEGKIDPGMSSTHFLDRHIFSAVTPYGKERMVSAFYFRISNDDLPMTYLWRHPATYTCNTYKAPIFQKDGTSPPMEGQMGGWAYCNFMEKNKLVKIPGFYKYRSYRRKLDQDGKKVIISEGELISNGEFAPLGG